MSYRTQGSSLVMRRSSTASGVALLAIAAMFESAAMSGCNSNTLGPPVTYTIGGTVIALAGTGGGLVLEDNLKDSLPINANGTFVFAAPVPSGGAYSVTIAAQPANPAQTCAITNGSGTAAANVTNIQVNCGHDEWTWVSGTNAVSAVGVYGTLGVTAMTNVPGGRHGAATWTDASGNFWMFGGYGYDSTGILSELNDLWMFSGGEWTWMGGPNIANQPGVYGSLGGPGSRNTPGSRYGAVTWTDPSGNVWLFGGSGYDSTGTLGYLNDLWKYSNGEWTWMSGADVPGQPGTYGTVGVPAAGNVPGARYGAVGWGDSSVHLWLFGGFGPDSTGTNGELDDLWVYNSGEWTWVAGSNAGRQNGVYGSQGVPAAANVPGARYWATGWIDSSGSVWLFGGQGYDGSSRTEAWLSDLWKYSQGQWTWISGPNMNSQAGLYGSEGVADPGNNPGARQEAMGWIDSKGNLWLFGGNGLDSANGRGLLNDLWKYNNGEWTWMLGSKLINQSGAYGARGVPFPEDVPGARAGQCGWIDPQGNLWLFSGYGAVSGTEGHLNDLWMYRP